MAQGNSLQLLSLLPESKGHPIPSPNSGGEQPHPAATHPTKHTDKQSHKLRCQPTSFEARCSNRVPPEDSVPHRPRPPWFPPSTGRVGRLDRVSGQVHSRTVPSLDPEMSTELCTVKQVTERRWPRSCSSCQVVGRGGEVERWSRERCFHGSPLRREAEVGVEDNLATK